MEIYYESEFGKLFLGDCLEILPKLDEKVDLVLTDPPYGTTQCKWDSVIPFDEMWSVIGGITKQGGIVCLFSAQPFSSFLVCSNPQKFRYNWVWKKSRVTGVLNAKKMPLRCVEDVLVFYDSKGAKTYNPQGLLPCDKMTSTGNTGRGNSDNYGKVKVGTYRQTSTGYPTQVLEYGSVGKTVHPTQKPVALMEYLIKTYTHIGNTVLDFTIGSGTTAVAAINTGRKFIGIEKEEKYCEIAKQRIVEAEEQYRLFDV